MYLEGGFSKDRGESTMRPSLLTWPMQERGTKLQYCQVESHRALHCWEELEQAQDALGKSINQEASSFSYLFPSGHVPFTLSTALEITEAAIPCGDGEGA